jgi:predicted GTPase
MGPTGVGKSTVRIIHSQFLRDLTVAQFIDLATGQGGRTVGKALKSFTAAVQAVRIPHPTTGRSIVFVDTPGFDDSTKSDTEVLRMIAQWLEKTCGQMLF